MKRSTEKCTGQPLAFCPTYSQMHELARVSELACRLRVIHYRALTGAADYTYTCSQALGGTKMMQ
jgi:hypothetical protein